MSSATRLRQRFWRQTNRARMRDQAVAASRRRLKPMALSPHTRAGSNRGLRPTMGSLVLSVQSPRICRTASMIGFAPPEVGAVWGAASIDFPRYFRTQSY